MDAATRRAALNRTEIFRDLPAGDMEAVLAHAKVRRIGRGEMILRRGDPSVGMFVVTAGRVRISLVSQGGKEVTLGLLGSGEVMGEMSLLDGEPCSADATALEDCVMLVIERSQLLRLLRANSGLCLYLLAILSRRLRRSNTALEDMALLDLPARLGRLLLRLGKDYGVAAGKGTRIELKLSQKDLSELVGGSREKVNKQLRQWEQEGILGKDGSRMVILQPHALTPLD